jgi:hypothetical protein
MTVMAQFLERSARGEIRRGSTERIRSGRLEKGPTACSRGLASPDGVDD